MAKDPYAYRPRKSPLESSVQKSVVTYARKEYGVEALKREPLNSRGFPDFEFYLPGGKSLLVEFKQKGKKPTPLQASCIAKLLRLGYDVQVIDNVKDGKALIDDRMGLTKYAEPREGA